MLKYMSTARESNGGCVRLAGAQNSWGQPVYWASPGDPEYDVRVPKVDEPPELDSLRVPVGAVAARTSDDAMTVFDLERGYVAALTGAKFLEEEGTWRASGATVTYLDSNGLHVDTGRADDPRNDGSHRGNNGATMMVRYDQYLAGRIDNVLKVASGPELSTRAVFPMVNSDGDSEDPEAPPQGLRLRVRPDVDLDSLDLHPEARVIAEALQRYGMYLGDSGGATALKLEDTAAEGGDQTWTVPSDGLCALPLTEEFWDVLPEGYHPGTANGSP